MQTPQYMTFRAVKTYLDTPRRWLREYQAKGKFPKPDLVLRKHINLWLQSTIDNWLKSNKAK